jgi:uncharacterized protein
MSERLFPAPLVDAESKPFHDAAAEGRFLIRRCGACGKAHWYPRAQCPFCFGATDWVAASGSGTVYSYSTLHAAKPPYTIAYVTLDEGPTVLTNLVNYDAVDLSVGMTVTAVFRSAAGGGQVLCFAPA